MHPADLASHALDRLCEDVALGRVYKPDSLAVTLALERLFPGELLIPKGSLVVVHFFRGVSWAIEEKTKEALPDEQKVIWLQRKLSTYM